MLKNANLGESVMAASLRRSLFNTIGPCPAAPLHSSRKSDPPKKIRKACENPPRGPNRGREVGGGRTTRQPGQVRKEAALTRPGGSLSSLLLSPRNLSVAIAWPELGLSGRPARPRGVGAAQKPLGRCRTVACNNLQMSMTTPVRVWDWAEARPRRPRPYKPKRRIASLPG